MNKKTIIIIGVVAVLALAVWGIWELLNRDKNSLEEEQTKTVYQVMVAIRDQKSSDPVEDARSSLKAGDVILAKSGENSPWSDTERTSTLILKMELFPEEAQKLIESVTEKNSDSEEAQENITLLRKYRIDFDEIDFDAEKWNGTQLFDDKIFDWSIVEKK